MPDSGGSTGTGGMYGTIPDSGGSTGTGGMYGTIPDSGGSTGTGGMTPYWELRFKEGQAFDTSDKEYKVIIQVQELPTQDNQNPVAVEQTMIITIDKIPVDDTLEIISLVDGFSLNFPNNQDKILFPFKPKVDHYMYSFLIADDDNNFEFNREGPDIYLKKNQTLSNGTYNINVRIQSHNNFGPEKTIEINVVEPEPQFHELYVWGDLWEGGYDHNARAFFDDKMSTPMSD